MKAWEWFVVAYRTSVISCVSIFVNARGPQQALDQGRKLLAAEFPKYAKAPCKRLTVFDGHTFVIAGEWPEKSSQSNSIHG